MPVRIILLKLINFVYFNNEEDEFILPQSSPAELPTSIPNSTISPTTTPQTPPTQTNQSTHLPSTPPIHPTTPVGFLQTPSIFWTLPQISTPPHSPGVSFSPLRTPPISPPSLPPVLPHTLLTYPIAPVLVTTAAHSQTIQRTTLTKPEAITLKKQAADQYKRTIGDINARLETVQSKN